MTNKAVEGFMRISLRVSESSEWLCESSEGLCESSERVKLGSCGRSSVLRISRRTSRSSGHYIYGSERCDCKNNGEQVLGLHWGSFDSDSLSNSTWSSDNER